jgi:hypothetical protein
VKNAMNDVGRCWAGVVNWFATLDGPDRLFCETSSVLDWMSCSYVVGFLFLQQTDAVIDKMK